MKTYKLPFGKTLDAVTYEQVQEMRKAGDLYIKCSTSQIMKRMDQDMFDEIMSDLASGESVEIVS